MNKRILNYYRINHILVQYKDTHGPRYNIIAKIIYLRLKRHIYSVSKVCNEM